MYQHGYNIALLWRRWQMPAGRAAFKLQICSLIGTCSTFAQVRRLTLPFGGKGSLRIATAAAFVEGHAQCAQPIINFGAANLPDRKGPKPRSRASMPLSTMLVANPQFIADLKYCAAATCATFRKFAEGSMSVRQVTKLLAASTLSIPVPLIIEFSTRCPGATRPRSQRRPRNCDQTSDFMTSIDSRRRWRRQTEREPVTS